MTRAPGRSRREAEPRGGDRASPSAEDPGRMKAGRLQLTDEMVEVDIVTRPRPTAGVLVCANMVDASTWRFLCA